MKVLTLRMLPVSVGARSNSVACTRWTRHEMRMARASQRRAYGLRDDEYLRLKALICMFRPL